jgi:hypothetical protein
VRCCGRPRALASGKQGKRRGGKQSYGQALELSLGFADALRELTYLNLKSKAPAKAMARLEPQVAQQPNCAAFLALLAKA